MKKLILLAAAALAFAAPAMSVKSGTATVQADYIAADSHSEAFTATGGVYATMLPFRFFSDEVRKNDENCTHFSPGTEVTTCSNAVDSLHWSIDGEIEYKEGDYVLGRNILVRTYGIPFLWLPYFYYPLDGESGFRAMVGYTGRWGAYLMTKYIYDIYNTPVRNRYAVWGNTRLDLRYENGIALGQEVSWKIGDFGTGHFKIYYAWDQDALDRYGKDSGSSYDSGNWGSPVKEKRYIMELEHRWEVTERDTLRLKGTLDSDSYMQSDFFRRLTLGISNSLGDPYYNELAWEHLENDWGVGVSVSGPLEEYYRGTSRLPEIYFDVAPTPLWGLPVNYESENRLGFLQHQAAHYSSAGDSAFAYTPGIWSDYHTVRFDTYHRLTAPFKVADVVSVVPRLAYRGTFWDKTGYTCTDGLSTAGSAGHAFRSVFESGVTFSGRGTAWIDDTWQSVLEPYADVLAQKAVMSGIGDDKRPYIFDNLDASSDWSDQFAGRGRNLPYTYVGVTPGLRHLFREMDDKGQMHNVFDIDVYAAMEFGRSSWTDGDKYHRLAKLEKPNYGKNSINVYPGVRARWFPSEGTSLGAQIEYDSDNSRIALASLNWNQVLTRHLRYYINYELRDYRWWDFSSAPSWTRQIDGETYNNNEFNWAHFSTVRVGLEHEICDALVWSPFIEWDCVANDLDRVGSWFDIRTDCLGFRLTMAYESDYYRIDGSHYPNDFSIGFFIYLRAFGADSTSSLTRF